MYFKVIFEQYFKKLQFNINLYLMLLTLDIIFNYFFKGCNLSLWSKRPLAVGILASHFDYVFMAIENKLHPNSRWVYFLCLSEHMKKAMLDKLRARLIIWLTVKLWPVQLADRHHLKWIWHKYCHIILCCHSCEHNDCIYINIYTNK